MREVERRIYLVSELFVHEFDYLFGNCRDVPCYVSYYNVKRGVETCHIAGNYRDCLAFARYRRNDRRYKNFEFFIYIEK